MLQETLPQSHTVRSIRAAQAGAATNAVLALAKITAGVLGTTYALVADGVESLADVASSLIVWGGVAVAARPADEDHPFGHGKSAYLWALLAATGTLVLGAGFAVSQGIRTIMAGSQEQGHYTVAYVVLAISFVLEGTSLLRAARQLRRGPWSGSVRSRPGSQSALGQPSQGLPAGAGTFRCLARP